MCEVLDRAENKGIKKGKEDAHLEAIKNIMKNLHMTAQQAMDVLEIPKEDWPMYEERL